MESISDVLPFLTGVESKCDGEKLIAVSRTADLYNLYNALNTLICTMLLIQYLIFVCIQTLLHLSHS